MVQVIDMHKLWLQSFSNEMPLLNSPEEVARWELSQFHDASFSVCLRPEMGDGFEIDGDIITGGPTGVLYGAYTALFSSLTGKKHLKMRSEPAYRLRMLDFWDNLDGSVERGYAGRSLFFDHGGLHYDPQRIRFLARLLASCGINAVCINNVNVLFEAQRLMEDLLPDVAELAGLFRPFGIRLMLSCDFALPIRHGLPTADPLDQTVQDFWRSIAEKIWNAIPDFAGFVVKADSEHRPGPFTYGRSHAEGANMLGDAVEPFGGVVVWRAFVYNCQQDWRDTTTDRPKAAYEHYMPLDGAFHDNVLLQIKNGPFDFQVREPISPLLLSLRKTHLALEFQLTQEYTGHQIDIYSMPGLFSETFAQIPRGQLSAVAAVANIGRDDNYVGHPFAALNLFAYGCMAWQPDLSPRQVTELWCHLTYPSLSASCEEKLVQLLMDSREIYEKYTAPLGLCWMVNPGFHYGPSPDGYEYQSWGTYHKADRNAVGIDRTAQGTGYVLQYPPEIQKRYADPAVCPDHLLLFFHRVPYQAVMSDGRTLIQRIYDDHFEGCEAVDAMSQTLCQIAPSLPEDDSRVCLDRMEKQKLNAREWRDVVNTFFHRLSGADDAKGRKIYD